MSKWLVITGGSRGIGAKTIQRFLDEGYHAINISRTPSDIASENITLDLAAPLSLTQISTKLSALLKNATHVCLVHNAAVYQVDKIGAIDPNKLQTMLDVNITAPMMLNNMIVPLMPASSAIIYIGSTLSELAVANRASYVVTKHAMIGMMRATTQDLAPLGIHACCICPGFVNTNMALQDVDRNAFDAFIADKVIAKRLIEPSEIAELIYFSATHPVINGSVLHANLGQVTS